MKACGYCRPGSMYPGARYSFIVTRKSWLKTSCDDWHAVAGDNTMTSNRIPTPCDNIGSTNSQLCRKFGNLKLKTKRGNYGLFNMRQAEVQDDQGKQSPSQQDIINACSTAGIVWAGAKCIRRMYVVWKVQNSIPVDKDWSAIYWKIAEKSKTQAKKTKGYLN